MTRGPESSRRPEGRWLPDHLIRCNRLDGQPQHLCSKRMARCCGVPA